MGKTRSKYKRFKKFTIRNSDRKKSIKRCQNKKKKGRTRRKKGGERVGGQFGEGQRGVQDKTIGIQVWV